MQETFNDYYIFFRLFMVMCACVYIDYFAARSIEQCAMLIQLQY